MRYLIYTSHNKKPFFTKWFNPSSHFRADLGMIVIDNNNNSYTIDGWTWEPIPEDEL